MALVTMALTVVLKLPATDIIPSQESLPVRVVLMGASVSADVTLAREEAASVYKFRSEGHLCLPWMCSYPESQISAGPNVCKLPSLKMSTHKASPGQRDEESQDGGRLEEEEGNGFGQIGLSSEFTNLSVVAGLRM